MEAESLLPGIGTLFLGYISHCVFITLGSLQLRWETYHFSQRHNPPTHSMPGGDVMFFVRVIIF